MLNFTFVSTIYIYCLNWVTLKRLDVLMIGGASKGNTEDSLGFISLKLIILLVMLNLDLVVIRIVGWSGYLASPDSLYSSVTASSKIAE